VVDADLGNDEDRLSLADQAIADLHLGADGHPD
jgi:hypothetical protein